MGVLVKRALFHNLLPIRLGNTILDSLMVGAMFSFLFGKLRRGQMEE
jgi:hypothetical protein